MSVGHTPCCGPAYLSLPIYTYLRPPCVLRSAGRRSSPVTPRSLHHRVVSYHHDRSTYVLLHVRGGHRLHCESTLHGTSPPLPPTVLTAPVPTTRAIVPGPTLRRLHSAPALPRLHALPPAPKPPGTPVPPPPSSASSRQTHGTASIQPAPPAASPLAPTAYQQHPPRNRYATPTMLLRPLNSSSSAGSFCSPASSIAS